MFSGFLHKVDPVISSIFDRRLAFSAVLYYALPSTM